MLRNQYLETCRVAASIVCACTTPLHVGKPPAAWNAESTGCIISQKTSDPSEIRQDGRTRCCVTSSGLYRAGGIRRTQGPCRFVSTGHCHSYTSSGLRQRAAAAKPVLCQTNRTLLSYKQNFSNGPRCTCMHLCAYST